MALGLEGMGRFSEPALLVLLSLAEANRHGYALMEDIKVSYGVAMGPGTLYGALARLEERGLIRPLPPHDRRRPYGLTPAGASALRSQLQTLQAVVEQGLRRLPSW